MHRRVQFTAIAVTVFLLLHPFEPGLCQENGRLLTPDGKLVKLKGSVANVKMVLGRGPGYFTLKAQEGREFSVRMGPVPFLLQNGFNLSVGNEVEIQGVQVNQEIAPPMIMAIEVKNLTSHKIIRLRDEQMRPMWCCRRGRACL